jgi:hypothetical protein
MSSDKELVIVAGSHSRLGWQTIIRQIQDVAGAVSTAAK